MRGICTTVTHGEGGRKRMEIANEIANMLNEIRDVGHYTNVELAEILGVHRSTISKMRFSHDRYKNPRFTLYRKISELYNQVKCGEGVKNEQ